MCSSVGGNTGGLSVSTMTTLFRAEESIPDPLPLNFNLPNIRFALYLILFLLIFFEDFDFSFLRSPLAETEDVILPL